MPQLCHWSATDGAKVQHEILFNPDFAVEIYYEKKKLQTQAFA